MDELDEDGICISCADEDLEDGELINCKICNQPMWRDSNEMTQWGMCQKCHENEDWKTYFRMKKSKGFRSSGD